ncbi:MAG: family peptidase, partial [Chitinophagaceae bacterium]|nr:family peptidase [Chitinophagaceae bacterium]
MELIAHGDTRIDNYFWMSDYFKEGPDSTKAVDYLKAENVYLDTMMAGTKEFQKTLFSEMKGRIREEDETVPYHDNGYWYYNREEEGKQYPVYCRKKGTLTAPEEILHDGNKAAEGKPYYNASGLVVSDNNQLLAIGEDDVSRRLYRLRFKNLVTGEYLPETILNTEGGEYAWAADNKTLFYILKDVSTLLGYQVWRHQAGTDPAEDVKVYEEKDNRHYLSLGRTKSKKYIIIYSELSEQESEHFFLDAARPDSEFTLFQSRTMGLVYDIDHYNDRFYIRTNLEAPNFRLMETSLDKTGKENWKEVIAHRPDIYLAGLAIFKDHLVLSERKEGLMNIRIMNHKDQSEHYIRFDEPAWLAGVAMNPDFNTPILRFHYTSLITPNAVYDYNMVTRDKELKKQQEVVGGYEKNNYVTERLFANSRDGIKVPVSIVYKKGMNTNGQNPLLLYAYGSYGYSTETNFSSHRLSLLNRGFIFAIAHTRGGQEMGRQW